jgi:hypothetical protein
MRDATPSTQRYPISVRADLGLDRKVYHLPTHFIKSCIASIQEIVEMFL